jgi:hypothetical protein
MAEPISYEVVTETWQRMAETPAEEAQEIINQMELEQPVIMVYLLALDEYPFSQTEREIVFYLGAVLWEVMKQSPAALGMVTEEALNQAEEANYQFLELLSNDTEADFMSATRTLIDTYGEPEVLRYLVEALMEDGAELDEDDYESALAAGWEAGDAPLEPLGDFTADDAEALLEAATSPEPIEMFEYIEEDDDEDFEDEGDEDFEDEDDEGDEEWGDFNIRPEYRGLAFVHLKTVLDALIQSRA